MKSPHLAIICDIVLEDIVLEDFGNSRRREMWSSQQFYVSMSEASSEASRQFHGHAGRSWHVRPSTIDEASHDRSSAKPFMSKGPMMIDNVFLLSSCAHRDDGK